MAQELARHFPGSAPEELDASLVSGNVARRRGELADHPKLRWSEGGVAVVPGGAGGETDTEEALVPAMPQWRVAERPLPRHLAANLDGHFKLFEQPSAESNMPHAVVVDDYGDELLCRWLSDYLHRCIYVRSRRFPAEAIELEAPDVVVHVVAEDRLGS